MPPHGQCSPGHWRYIWALFCWSRRIAPNLRTKIPVLVAALAAKIPSLVEYLETKMPSLVEYLVSKTPSLVGYLCLRDTVFDMGILRNCSDIPEIYRELLTITEIYEAREQALRLD